MYKEYLILQSASNYDTGPCPPVTLEGGIVISRGNKIGDLATYQCSNGLNIVGNIQRQCLPSRRWSGNNPVCQRKLLISIAIQF